MQVTITYGTWHFCILGVTLSINVWTLNSSTSRVLYKNYTLGAFIESYFLCMVTASDSSLVLYVGCNSQYLFSFYMYRHGTEALLLFVMLGIIIVWSCLYGHCMGPLLLHQRNLLLALFLFTKCTVRLPISTLHIFFMPFLLCVIILAP